MKRNSAFLICFFTVSAYCCGMELTHGDSDKKISTLINEKRTAPRKPCQPLFCQMPLQVKCHVAHFLPNSDLINVSLTCKTMLNDLRQKVDCRLAVWILGHCGCVKPHVFINLIKRVISLLPTDSCCMQALVARPHVSCVSIGDLHGGFRELVAQIGKITQLGLWRPSRPFILKHNRFLAFTGDYIDRGDLGLEALQLIFALKLLNRDNVFILRGNHESEEIASLYGFFDLHPTHILDCIRRGIIPRSELLEKNSTFFDYIHVKSVLVKLFECLPIALFIGAPRKDTQRVKFGFFCHAGLDARARKGVIKLLSCAACHRGVLCTQKTKLSQYNGFMWGDLYADMVEPIKPNSRGCSQVFDYNKMGVNHVLTDWEPIDGLYTIDFISRGHSHRSGGALELMDAPCGTDFRALINTVPVVITNNKPVYMFMSLNLDFFSKTEGITDIGFGIFRDDVSSDHWILTPYIITRNDMASGLNAE